MKETKLIKGKWYKAYAQQNYYVKYLKTDNSDYAWCSEYVSNNKNYNVFEGCCGNAKYLTPINIKKIAHLLPKNHPDLKQLNKTYELW